MAGIIEAAAGISTLVGGVLDRFWPAQMSEDEKVKATAALTAQVEGYVAQREAAQRDVMVAELAQGDNYTKRARPTIVYVGLAFIGLVHVLMPMAAWLSVLIREKPLPEMPALSLPSEFWWAWSGVCGVYAIGRSIEKIGGKDPVAVIKNAVLPQK